MAEKESELIADQNEVLRYLTAVMRGESTSEEIIVEGIGDGRSKARKLEKTPSEKDRLKAAELILSLIHICIYRVNRARENVFW